MNTSVAFITLGCAKNEVDTTHMQERLSAAGFTLTNSLEDAHFVVVNTCSFIQAATEESIEAILEASELPNIVSGDAQLIVAGCMPSRYGKELEKELPEVSSFIPCNKEEDIVELISQLSESNFATREVSSEALPDSSEQERELDGEQSSGPVSAYVKISDGCNRFCSYCAIPYIRGRYHSFSYDSIAQEVDLRIAQGAKEIVLIAQDTGRWGTDFDNPTSLAQLLTKLAESHPSTWFRVMYIQPEGITDELLDAVASHDNICSYFDIPLQQVSERLLHLMNRKGSAEDFRALLMHIKERIPEVTLRTTFIAGFPGETEDEFEALFDFVAEGYFDYIGVFAYSREEGTRAYDLPNQLTEEEKLDRAQQLRDLADSVCAPKISERIGKEMLVLIEGEEEDGQLFGRAMCQAPEVDGVTYVQQGNTGDIVTVTIADTLLYEMEGE